MDTDSKKQGCYIKSKSTAATALHYGWQDRAGAGGAGGGMARMGGPRVGVLALERKTRSGNFRGGLDRMWSWTAELELPFLETGVDAEDRSRHMVFTDGEGLISFVCVVSRNVPRTEYWHCRRGYRLRTLDAHGAKIA